MVVFGGGGKEEAVALEDSGPRLQALIAACA